MKDYIYNLWDEYFDCYEMSPEEWNKEIIEDTLEENNIEYTLEMVDALYDMGMDKFKSLKEELIEELKDDLKHDIEDIIENTSYSEDLDDKDIGLVLFKMAYDYLLDE